ncbi:hypothetical protein JNO54_12255 [Janibacter sp. YIM B02568]|uniref:DUF6912 family protein n=1 Tax=Janibacter endophyticus TaxID=2806261 RepID=UPI0019502110|nr:hypothetical protein [Janibacter endophyticus]MBM6546902.1 hypothetical protein [Janibacter endophyticus]
MSRRVYLGLVESDLAEVARSTTVPAALAFGVTDAERTARPAEDEEDLEFEAMCEALDAAGSRRRTKSERRVVASADVPSAQDGQGWSVVLPGTVALEDVVSFHVEESEGTSAGEGYDDLLWYDVTELADLVTHQG